MPGSDTELGRRPRRPSPEPAHQSSQIRASSASSVHRPPCVAVPETDRDRAPTLPEAFDAGHVLDEMSDRKRKRKAATADRISGLPDEVLHRVLWFLPTREAVRTSVLARRWFDLWKSTRRLSVSHSWTSKRAGRSQRLVRLLAQNRGRPRRRIRSRGLPRLSLARLSSVAGGSKAAAVDRLNKFVNRLLLIRHHVPLDECRFSFRGFPRVDAAQVDSWIQHALSSRVRVLHLHLGTKVRTPLAHWPLSRHLKIMELSEVKLKGYSLLFLDCPSLEDLKMHSCTIRVKTLFSLSLKHLKITSCKFTFGVITSVSVPKLLSLELADCEGPTPVLHLMPSLERAYVKFGRFDEDHCWNGLGRDDSESSSEDCHRNDINEGHHGEGVNEGHFVEATDEDLCSECVTWGHCGICAHCGCYYDDNRVLLFGLTRATHLELVPSYYMFTIKRDLRWCGTFSNLSTLVLHEWCLHTGFYALLGLLQRAPHLRMLTLKLYKGDDDHDHSVKGFNNLKQACKLMYLRFVEIEYKQADNMLWELLKILDAWGTSLVQCKLRRVSL